MFSICPTNNFHQPSGDLGPKLKRVLYFSWLKNLIEGSRKLVVKNFQNALSPSHCSISGHMTFISKTAPKIQKKSHVPGIPFFSTLELSTYMVTVSIQHLWPDWKFFWAESYFISHQFKRAKNPNSNLYSLKSWTVPLPPVNAGLSSRLCFVTEGPGSIFYVLIPSFANQ